MGEGELDFEGAALAGFAADFDLTIVFVDDAADEREAKSGAGGFGGVKGAKDLGDLLWRHAAASVGDGDDGAVVL